MRPSFNFLTDVLRCCYIIFLPHDAIYFVKCTSPSCSKAPPQHDAATPMLHGWDGVLRLASITPFPPNITMVIIAKQFYFCFIRLEDISLKSTIFVTICSCKLSSVFFMAVLEQWLLPCREAFQVKSIWDSFYCGNRYFCNCLLPSHLHKVLCCCSGIVPAFSNPFKNTPQGYILSTCIQNRFTSFLLGDLL